MGAISQQPLLGAQLLLFGFYRELVWSKLHKILKYEISVSHENTPLRIVSNCDRKLRDRLVAHLIGMATYSFSTLHTPESGSTRLDPDFVT